MTERDCVCSSYRIEISGWDQAEDFFVEKTELDWSEQHGKRVYLRHSLRPGSLVFVRLIHPTAGQNSPVAYQVEKVTRADPNGVTEVHLAQLTPRLRADGNGEQAPAPVPEEKLR